MNDRSWMYRVSSKELHMIDYCKGVEGFIHYVLSNTKNISGGSIRDVKIKSILIQMLSQCIFYKKTFMEKYLCWFVYREPYVPYETMLEKMIGSTFNSSNVHRVVDDNSDYYKSIVMAVMRMN